MTRELLSSQANGIYNLVTADFRDLKLPKSDLVFVDPPFGLGKTYDGIKEEESYDYWVNTILESTEAPWKIFIAPPISADWLTKIPAPSRIIYWCKTFVQLRKLEWWQYAVTPILVYREENAPWYGKTYADKRPGAGLENFDWIIASSSMTDVKAINTFHKGMHPGVTGTQISKQILKWTTKPGDFILDPMAGLGSILVAATKMGVNSLGVEISEEYANAGRRWLDSL